LVKYYARTGGEKIGPLLTEGIYTYSIGFLESVESKENIRSNGPERAMISVVGGDHFMKGGGGAVLQGETKQVNF